MWIANNFTIEDNKTIENTIGLHVTNTYIEGNDETRRMRGRNTYRDNIIG